MLQKFFAVAGLSLLTVTGCSPQKTEPPKKKEDAPEVKLGLCLNGMIKKTFGKSSRLIPAMQHEAAFSNVYYFGIPHTMHFGADSQIKGPSSESLLVYHNAPRDEFTFFAVNHENYEKYRGPVPVSLQISHPEKGSPLQQLAENVNLCRKMAGFERNP
jgi:hypothetical protein